MIHTKKKICVVTTARSDYGLLYWLMKEIQGDSRLRLQVVVSGMHLEPEFGNTYRVIEKDGFRIDAKIRLFMKGGDVGDAARSLAAGFPGFATAFTRLKPDLLVVLGDRYELIPPAVTAVLAHIPVAHIHGGETTEGAVDELVRHALTKLSVLHFASTPAYRRRIIQMGEHPERVFCFGAPGIDTMYKLKLFSRRELENALSFSLAGPWALITYHPATLEDTNPGEQIRGILSAVKKAGLNGVCTMANADPGGSTINRIMREFCGKNHRRFLFVKNLGQRMYLSCMKHCDVVVGNSSSGIVESSSFGVPVVDIGTRQKGRLRAANVLHASSAAAVFKTLKQALSPEFRNAVRRVKSPYDFSRDGKTAVRIRNELARALQRGIAVHKSFFDLE